MGISISLKVVSYTDSFSPNEVDRLRSILLTKLNIESTRVANNKAKEQYAIPIPKREVVASTPTEGGGHPSAQGHSRHPPTVGVKYSNG